MYLWEFWNELTNEHIGLFGFTEEIARERGKLGNEWVCIDSWYEDC